MSEYDADVCAVVVSWNRRALLAEVLDALGQQTVRPTTIYVVDNGSDDGSREMLMESYPHVRTVFTAKNVGGAGGFARGLAWALQGDHDFVWLMDDDAVPQGDCLELLLNPMSGFPDLVYCTPRVLGEDGGTGPRNFPILDASDVPAVYRWTTIGVLPIVATTFVGPLLRCSCLRMALPPVEDFFIWHDDMEYTSRLRQLGPAVVVPSAGIVHKTKSAGPDAYLAGRNFYNVRNMIWWARSEKRSSLRRRIALTLVRNIVRQARAAPSKRDFSKTFLRSVYAGLSRPPAMRTFEEIIVDSRSQDTFNFSTSGN